MSPSRLRPYLRFALPVFALSLLAACRTTPRQASQAPLSPVAPVAVASSFPEPEAPPPPGVTLSPPLTGDPAAPEIVFSIRAPNERTFPHNAIGANLAFTANLRMPRLEAVTLDPKTFQLRMRFSNASDTPLYVSLVCTYEGESRAAHSIRRVQFPVNTFRDIALDLQGDPSRKLNIQATAIAVDAAEGSLAKRLP
jgi:hypothetical protein